MINRAKFIIVSLIVLITALIACQNKSGNRSKVIGYKNPGIIYTEKQLEDFLDSVGNLSTQPLVSKSLFLADSVFTHQTQINKILSAKSFNVLKTAALKGSMNIAIAKEIFVDEKIDSICKNINTSLEHGKNIPIIFYSFDKEKTSFDEYVICLGDPTHCSNAYLYFFKKNKIISKHYGYNRYGIDLAYYQDIDGKTVVYYRQEFVSGSGNWWHQYFFYKFNGDILLPVLNELQNGNIASGAIGNRVLWLESFVQKTNPLTIKMVYNDQLPDTTKDDFGPMFINDSTLVEYTWDKRSKKLIGQYKKSKLSQAQVLSYNLEDNDILFINTHYKKLMVSLADKSKRNITLKYLNFVKNHSK